jgi:hypothetical protein
MTTTPRPRSSGAEQGGTTLELTTEEGQELRLILTSYLSDLRMEIADTDRQDFRESLKRREEFIKVLLSRLFPGPGGST